MCSNGEIKIRQKFIPKWFTKSEFLRLTGHRQPSDFEGLLQWSFTEISLEHYTNPEIKTFSALEIGLEEGPQSLRSSDSKVHAISQGSNTKTYNLKSWRDGSAVRAPALTKVLSSIPSNHTVAHNHL